jgi:hypothetical protein
MEADVVPGDGTHETAAALPTMPGDGTHMAASTILTMPGDGTHKATTAMMIIPGDGTHKTRVAIMIMPGDGTHKAASVVLTTPGDGTHKAGASIWTNDVDVASPRGDTQDNALSSFLQVMPSSTMPVILASATTYLRKSAEAEDRNACNDLADTLMGCADTIRAHCAVSSDVRPFDMHQGTAPRQGTSTLNVIVLLPHIQE